MLLLLSESNYRNNPTSLSNIITNELCPSLDTLFYIVHRIVQSPDLKSFWFQQNIFEMIFAFLLLLQMVRFNVEGKHFLVETQDGGEQREVCKINVQC